MRSGSSDGDVRKAEDEEEDEEEEAAPEDDDDDDEPDATTMRLRRTRLGRLTSALAPASAGPTPLRPQAWAAATAAAACVF